MTRHVLTVNLKDTTAVQTYRQHHLVVWPEVLESLRQIGVIRMDIHALGRRLVMVVEMADGLDYRKAFAAHVTSNPRVAEWEQLMRSLQEPSPDAAAGEWWAAMEPVFCLDEQEPAVAHAARRSTS